MKKILSILVCTLVLAAGAMEAKAALLKDWNYELNGISLDNVNTNFVTVATDGSLSFTTGNYNINLEAGNTKEETLTFPGDNSAASSKNDTLVTQITSTNDTAKPTAATKIADLTFSYRVEAVDNPGVWMSTTYTIPLYTYYDVATSTAYIYYNNREVMSGGATAFTHDGYAYGITGVGLFVDDRALVTLPGAEGDQNLYTGWAINEDTMNNYYEEYEVGGDNNVSIGGKTGEDYGKFDITGSLSITNKNNNPDPAPTPEPATMLLMGLGLAGLGFVARRRNK